MPPNDQPVSNAGVTPVKFTNVLPAVAIIYAVFIMLGIVNHEPWRDEAQAWLIVRDAGFTDLFSILRTEGHPPLWYLLILPLAKAGLPYAAQNWLAGIICMAAVYIFLFKTKLPLIVKILLPFSYYIFYEYSCLARSYCLLPLFIALLISIHHKRFQQPIAYALIIVGLCNTHVLAFTFAIAIAAVFTWQAFQQKMSFKKLLPFMLAVSIGGGYLLPNLYNAEITAQFNTESDPLQLISKAINGGVLIGQQETLAILILLSTSALLFIKNKQAALVFLCGLAGMFYILAFRYDNAGIRHSGLIFLMLVYCTAITNDKPNSGIHMIYIPLLATILLQLVPSAHAYSKDIQTPFSGAKDAAAFLKEKNLDKKILVGYQAWTASSIIPYLQKDKKMFYSECSRYGSYYMYDSCFINKGYLISVEKAVDIAYDQFKGRLQDVVFVFNTPVNVRAMQYLDLVYESPEPVLIENEYYYIYRFKAGVK